MSSFVFIDSRVANIDGLIAALDPDTQFFLLDAEADGIEQMVCALHEITSLGSLHIVSHGSSGTRYLGSTVLTQENLDDYQTELSRVGASLAADGAQLIQLVTRRYDDDTTQQYLASAVSSSDRRARLRCQVKETAVVRLFPKLLTYE